MSTRLHYSREKFLNFSFDSQLKALGKLLAELEYQIADKETREAIIHQLKELISLCKEELPQAMKSLFDDLPQDPHRLLRRLADYHLGKTFKDSQIKIRIGDGRAQADERYLAKAKQVVLIADNLRSVFNVGSLFRACECLGIGELYLCGITPTPKHPNMEKTALGTTEKVKWRYFAETSEALKEIKNKGMKLYALETAEPSASVFEHLFSLPMALVVGNEALGIAPDILSKCDEVVYLPVLGWKNSLNVSVACTVALYQVIFGG